jgi:hypothetical protein
MNKERLEKLANHLLTGQLGHKNFNLDHWNTGFKQDESFNQCGTTGCAIGECPIIFPEYWRFEPKDGLPILKQTPEKNNWGIVWECIMAFFEISHENTQYLFSNESYELGGYTAKEEVAERILNFIKDNETLTDSQFSS